MMYDIKFTERAIKDLKKLDPPIAKMILSWLEKNLSRTQNPRAKGKALSKEKKRSMALPSWGLQNFSEY